MRRIFPLLTLRSRLLMTIGTLTLLITVFAGHEVFVRWQKLGRVEDLMRATQLGDALFKAGTEISVERHIAYSVIYAANGSTVDDLEARLAKSRRNTNRAIMVMMPLLKEYESPGIGSKIRLVSNDIQKMRALRAEMDKDAPLPRKRRDQTLPARWFGCTDGLVDHMQALWLGVIKNFIGVDPTVYAQMRFKYFIWGITEYTGRERSVIGRLIAENAAATPQEQKQLLLWQGVVNYFWRTVDATKDFGRLAPALVPYLKDAKSDYDNVYDMLQGTFLLPATRMTKSYPLNTELWLELSTQSDQSLYTLEDVALKKTRAYVSRLKDNVRREIALHFAMLLITLLLCAYSFWVVLVRVLRPVNIMIGALVSAAQGKAVSPVLTVFRQADEIGQLAQVLSAFQKNAEELQKSAVTMQLYVDELKRSNQELDDFAYIASHDLKEPLRGLTTQAAFLLEDYKDNLDAEGLRRLRRLQHLSLRMEKLISNLLYFSRLGRADLAVQELDINAAVAEIRQMMEAFLKERNARISVPQPLPPVVCDRLKITEVLRNLITNAVKYNDKPERVVEIGFLEKMQAPHGQERNVFYVRDNGIGIDPKFHDAIFRIFKRLENPAVKQEEGTGSGLTFVKKIIERHKGRIWLESAPGDGSTFYFTIGRIDA